MTSMPNMRPALAVALLLAAVKAGLFLAFGPYFVDGDHAGIARQILDGPWDWLRHRSLAEPGWNQLDAWRPLGYGAFLALCELVAGPHWVAAAVGMQLAARVACLLVLYRCAHAFTGRVWPALFAMVAYDTGESMLLDLAAYPDSLFSDVFAAAFLTMVTRFHRRRPFSPRLALAAGAAMALGLVLKEAAVPFTLMLAGTAFLWARRAERGWLGAVVAGALVLAPVTAVGAAVAGWNYWRTGHAFLTVGARTAMAVPLAGMAAMGVPVFDRDEPMDRLAREALAQVAIPPGTRTPDMVGQTHVMARINYGLWECCRLDGFAINEQVSRRYRETVLNHPLGVLKLMAAANHWHVLGFFQPGKSVGLLYDLNHGTVYGTPRPLHMIARASADPLGAVFGALQAAELVVAALLMVAFYGLFPLRLLGLYRHGSRDLWLFWLAHLAILAFYSAIWLEHRYLMPTMPGAEVVAVAMLVPLLRRRAA